MPILELGDSVRRSQSHMSGLSRDTSLAFLQLLALEGAGLTPGWVARAGISLERPGVIVGVRDIASYEALLARLPEAITLAIQAPVEIRTLRSWRGNESEERIREITMLHESWGLDAILRRADCCIENCESRSEFELSLSNFAQQLLAAHQPLNDQTLCDHC